MLRHGSTEEFGEVWTLNPADLTLVAGLPDAGRLGLAAQLAHWRALGRFPDDAAELPPAARSGTSRPNSASAPMRSRPMTGRAGPAGGTGG